MQLNTTGHESRYGSAGHELVDETRKKRAATYKLNDSTPGMNNYYDYTDMTTNHTPTQSNSSHPISPATPQLGMNNDLPSYGFYPYDNSYNTDPLYEPALDILRLANSSHEHMYDGPQPKQTAGFFDENSDLHLEAALACCETPPCTDPHCDDFVFCEEEASCCYLEQCLIGEPCDDEECHVETVASPPCFSPHCDEPPCTEAHTTTFCPHEHGDLDHAANEPMHTCINPACLSKMSAQSHFPPGDDLPTRSVKRRKLSQDCCDAPMQNSHVHPFSHLVPDGHTTPAHHEVNALDQLSRIAALNQFQDFKLPNQVVHKHTNNVAARQELDEDSPHICRWIEGNRVCGATFSDEQILQQHVDTQHISGPTKQDSYCCYWEGCSKASLTDSVEAIKLEQIGDDDSSIPDNATSRPMTPLIAVSGDGSERRAFGTRPKLKRHVQVHTGYKPYKCDTCGVQMKTKDALVKHLRTHTGEKPYVCSHCDKKFATTTELKTHSTVHTGDKPHTCPECGERFADSSNLSKHKKTHFSGMFKCEECGAQMKRWDQMKRHIEQRKHMQYLLTDMEANRAYKGRMMNGFKPERVETKTEQKKRRDGTSVRSFSTFSETDLDSAQTSTN